MIDTFEIYKELKEDFPDKVAKKLATLMGKMYKEIVNTVTKEEFKELKKVVEELAEAQRRTERGLEDFKKATEENFRRVWSSIEELTEAQKKTEQRVEELTRAQKKTEQRVEELTRAQKKTEQRVEELAEAQRRTEEELRELIQEHKETRKQLGGLTTTVGYSLENQAYRALPELLKRDHSLVVEGRLKRAYIKDRHGRYIEVNIIGDGKINGKKVKIVGEGKAQLSKRDVDAFVRKKLKRLEGVFEEVFPVLVTHMGSSHDVEEYALKKGIKVYYSYEF